MRKFLLFIGFACFISCTKESNDKKCSDLTLISQIKINNYDVQKITYNSSCQVVESIEPFQYHNYIYNNLNQLVKIEEKISFNSLSCYMPTGASGETFTDPKKAKVISYKTFDYNPDGTIRRKSQFFNYSDEFKQVSYELYSYMDSKVVKTESYDINDKLVSYTIFDYDEKGNVKSSNYFLMVKDAAVLKQSITYQHDNKLNPFRIFSFEGTPGIHTNLNNIVSEMRTTYELGKSLDYTTNYSLEYNDLGYPSKVNDRNYLYGN